MPVARWWTGLGAVGAPTPQVEEGRLDLQGTLGSQSGLVPMRALCRDMIHPSVGPPIRYVVRAYHVPGTVSAPRLINNQTGKDLVSAETVS